MIDSYVACCRDIKHYLNLLKPSEFNNTFISDIASRIMKRVSAADDTAANYKYIDAYLKELRQKRMLNPHNTSIVGRTPFAVCCALYGLWGAVPTLMQDGVIGTDKNQMNISFCVNFSCDLLDWIIPEL